MQLDRAHVGPETGSPIYPFNTVTEGLNTMPAAQYGTVWVKPGTYGESLTIDKSITFTNWGAVSIIIE